VTPKSETRKYGNEEIRKFWWIAVLCLVILPAGAIWAQGPAVTPPQVSIQLTQPQTPEDTFSALQVLFLLSVIVVAPSLLMLLTSFTRIVIVLSFLRTALGTPQVPPNQVLLGLALFLTLFVMTPTFNQINEEAIQPYLAKKISTEEAYTRGLAPLRAFMLRQTRQNDLALFLDLAGLPKPGGPEDVPTYACIPAFVLSELKTAFEIGFILYIPFLLVDLIVASTVMSLGMMMLPPMMISLPFKILLFVMVDGWHLVMRGLALSFA
jgi:flagellar biosynthetic protein FliP